MIAAIPQYLLPDDAALFCNMLLFPQVLMHASLQQPTHLDRPEGGHYGDPKAANSLSSSGHHMGLQADVILLLLVCSL